jgi:capsid protein
MSTLDDRLKKARKLAELDQIKRQRAEDKMRTNILRRADDIRARIDALETSHNTQRNQSTREKKGEDGLYTSQRKLKGVALARDLQRNGGWFKGLVHQFKVNVVGVGPKIRLATEDKNWNKASSTWFNGGWAKWCDGVDDSPLADMLQMALMSVKREGDCVCVFDDFDRDDGTIRWFESDQLPTIDEGSWKKEADKRGFLWKERVPGKTKLQPMKQKDGLVIDRRGRVMAYVLDAQHGRTNVLYEEVMIVPRWHQVFNRAGSAKLLKSPWRLTQKRGQGDALVIANQQADIYEMIAADLQSAKNIAQRAGWIEVDKDAEGGVMRALLNSNLSQDEIDKLLYGDGEQRGSLATQYEELEGTFGGRLDYLNAGESFHTNDHDKPSSSVKDFAGYIQESNGASMGLSRSSSTLKAEASYTAFRGEQVMSWQTYEVDQKSMERRLMDFLGFKSIDWAIRKGQLDKGPEGWENLMLWVWPRMREVDEHRTATAQATKLKNGTITYDEIHGPDWDKKFQGYAEQLDFGRDLGLPLAVYETKSGGPAQAGAAQGGKGNAASQQNGRGESHTKRDLLEGRGLDQGQVKQVVAGS